MLKLNYFLADIFILSAEKQPIKLSWRKIEWLRFANQDLPQGLQVDKATNIPNLKETVARLFDQAEACFENPKMQGCLILLENIKAKLES